MINDKRCESSNLNRIDDYAQGYRVGRPAALTRVFLLLSLLVLLGCSRQSSSSNYGHSSGALGRGSPGGYSVFREYCKEYGFRTSTVENLTPAVKDFDVIVWAPDSFNEHDRSTITWLEDWLSENGKTLVYIGRDYSAYADLLGQSLQRELNSKGSAFVPGKRSALSPNQVYEHPLLQEKQLTADEAQVALEMELDSLKLLKRKIVKRSVLTLPWALHDLREHRWRLVSEIGGDWADLLKGKEHRIVYRSVLRPYDQLDDDLAEQSVHEIEEVKRNRGEGEIGQVSLNPNPNSPASPSPTVPANPASAAPSTSSQSTSSSSTSLSVEDLDLLAGENWSQVDYIDRLKNEFKKGSHIYLSETLIEDIVSSRPAAPLLTRLTRNLDIDHHYADESQIFVVSTPSLISNYSMTFSGNREVGKQLIGQFQGQRIGFISKPSDPAVFGDDYRVNQKGFEFLTKWPMSLISLHAALAGAVVLIALFPILGRPRKLPVRSTQDFSQHIVALGDLLERTDDHDYAKRVIGDYFRTVKRDIHSIWADESSDNSARQIKD